MVTLDQLLDGLRGLEIFSDKEIQELRDAGSADTGWESLSRLTNQLVDQGKLTSYQCRMILDGRANEVLLGDYVLLDKIGEGGMGQVYLAMHRHMQRRVAVKVLPAAAASSPEAVVRFRREIRTIARLSHPNVVAAYDAGEDRGVLYLAMEYVAGETLLALVKRRGTLAVPEAVDYIRQVARGLQAAHASGIIHRDVKPANLVRDPSGLIKILDMGVARLVGLERETIDSRDLDTLTSADQIVGTIDFMAPEQASAGGTVDHRVDIYSLGCCLYYLLTARLLYSQGSAIDRLLAHRREAIPALREARADVPDALDAAFRRMVAKQPADRYLSAADVCDALEPWSSQQLEPPASALTTAETCGITPPFVTPVVIHRKGAWWKNQRFAVLLMGVVLLAAAVVVIGRRYWGSPGEAVATDAARRLPNAAPAIVLRGHTNTVECLAFTPDGSQLISGDDDEAILVWSLAAAKLDFALARGKQSGPCLALDPSGSLLATACGDDVVKLWNLSTRKETATMAGQRVMFSPVGHLLAVASDANITLYDTTTQQPAGDLLGHDGHIFALAFAADGRTLVSGDSGGTVIAWDVEQQSPRHRLELGSTIYTASVAPGLPLAATGGEGGLIQMWDPISGRRDAALRSDRHRVLGVAFSRDSRQLAAVGGEGTVTLWDVNSLEQAVGWQATSRGESCAVAFSPDGHYLATGGDDLMVRLWDLDAVVSQP